MGPYFIVTSRILFSALILIIPVIYFKYRFKWKMLRSFIILGLINAVIPYILITWGEIYIPSWLASILLSIVPFFTNLFAALFFKEENFSLQKLAGLLLGFAGVIVLMLNNNGSQPSSHYLAILAIMVAAICYSASNIYTRKYTAEIPPILLAFGQMISAFIIITPIALGMESPIVLPRENLTWISLITLGIFSGAIALVLFFSLIKSIGPSRTSLVTYAFPLIGVILGILFLGEKASWHLLAGAPLIICGILVVNIPSLKRRGKKIIAGS